MAFGLKKNEGHHIREKNREDVTFREFSLLDLYFSLNFTFIPNLGIPHRFEKKYTPSYRREKNKK